MGLMIVIFELTGMMMKVFWSKIGTNGIAARSKSVMPISNFVGFKVRKNFAKVGLRTMSSVNFESRVTTNPNKVLVTCEHAGTELPSGMEWGKGDVDRDLNTLHWAYDPGAKEFSEELSARLEAPLVMSVFSRLFVDVNRPVASPTLARKLCDGLPVELNETLTEAGRQERILKYYLPYHFEVERVANETRSEMALSIHTYTDNYEGNLRDFEIGVLYSTNSEKLAGEMTQKFLDAGISAKINAPWSGKDGFMFSADNFVYNSPTPGARKAIMLEFRNDVCTQKTWRDKVIAVLAPLIEETMKS